VNPNIGLVQRRAARVTWLLLYLLVALIVGRYYLFLRGAYPDTFIADPKIDIRLMMEGTGPRPYVGRMLVPMVLTGMHHLTTPAMRDAEASLFSHQEFVEDLVHFRWLDRDSQGGYPAWPIDLVDFYFLSYAIFFGIAMAGRAAYTAVYGKRGVEANLAGLLLLLAVPLWFHLVSFCDPTTVLLGACLIYASARGNVWLACLFFVLACINKETAALYIPVVLYGLWLQYKAAKKQDYVYYMVLAGVVMGVSYLLVQEYRIAQFANNPGVWLEQNFNDVQGHLFTKYLPAFLFADGVMAVMLTFSFINFRKRPPILKAGVLCVFIPLAIAAVLFGRIIEIRSFYDAYPILGLMAIPTVLAITGIVPDTNNKETPAIHEESKDELQLSAAN
jgi:hypothetical protein